MNSRIITIFIRGILLMKSGFESALKVKSRPIDLSPRYVLRFSSEDSKILKIQKIMKIMSLANYFFHFINLILHMVSSDLLTRKGTLTIQTPPTETTLTETDQEDGAELERLEWLMDDFKIVQMDYKKLQDENKKLKVFEFIY